MIVLLTACMSMGREVKSDQLTGFVKGKTSITEVTSSLGQPTSATITADGKQFLTYTFAHYQSRPASFIPIVGLFAGGADMRSSVVMFTFDKSGILEDYTQTQSINGIGQGFNSGEYRALDSTLPQEQTK